MGPLAVSAMITILQPDLSQSFGRGRMLELWDARDRADIVLISIAISVLTNHLLFFFLNWNTHTMKLLTEQCVHYSLLIIQYLYYFYKIQCNSCHMLMKKNLGPPMV